MQKFLAVLIIFFSVAFDTTAQDEFNCISCPPEEAITQANIAQIRHFGLLERATLELVFSAYLDERNYRIFYLSLPPRFASANIVFPMFVRTNERFPDDYIFDMTGLGTEYDFTSVAYSPDVSIAASGNEQGQITFWDIEQQESLQDSDELGLPVTDMVFHPEETWLAAIYDDAQVGIYKLGDEDLQWLISADDAVSISNAVFSVDGDVLAIAVDSMLQVWDSDNLSQLASTSIAGMRCIKYWLIQKKLRLSIR